MTVAASFAATLVDEWVRSGLTDAVVSPGSRSTPLAMALAREGRIALHVRLDERSAGFFALGMALATGRPAIVLTTSGTAAAELHAAVVEAHMSRVPMIVCTADRPPELHHVGSPQTIEQAGLFAGSLRWSVDPGVPDGESRWAWRSMASRLVAEATSGPMGPGPVHANLAFREPLLDEPEELPPGRRNGRPWHRCDPVRRLPEPATVDALVGLARPAARGVIVSGAGSGRPEVVRRLAGALGWPVLADTRSGARVPSDDGSPTVAAADALLRDEAFAASHVPEIIVRLGAPWASKVVASWLASCGRAGAAQVQVDPQWAWRDPGREADLVVSADPDHVVEALLARVPDAAGPGRSSWAAPASWSASWAEAEATAQSAIAGVLSRHGEATEPGTARSLFAWAPPGSSIVASSSMPVRDLEWFAAPRFDPPRVLANRGANGIDGITSTTLGVAAAAAGTGGPVVGLLGDLAFLHDATALWRGRRESSPAAVLVVVDNGGGGIFSFLPPATELDDALFERLYGTPQRPDVADLARAAGCDTLEVMASADLRAKLDAALGSATRRGPSVVVVRTDRKANLALHSELQAEVSLALA